LNIKENILFEAWWEAAQSLRDRDFGAALLVAPPGLGVGEFSVGVAAGLLCHGQQPNAAPCGTCPSCKWVEEGQHPDFRWIRPASEQAADDDAGSEAEEGPSSASDEIRIDQIRGLSTFVQTSAHRGGHRVAVIGPVERLNHAAANALLKSLEEPTEGLHYILYGERLQGVPATILSRCRRLNLSAPSAMVASQRAAQAHQLGWLVGLLSEPRLQPMAWAERAATAGDSPAVIGLLQLWLSDVIRLRMGLPVQHFPESHSALAAHAQASPHQSLATLSDGQALLLQRSRQARHPLNPRLFMETVFDEFCCAIAPRAADAGRR
jgi:DNA polymerase-3 subunit delta'